MTVSGLKRLTGFCAVNTKDNQRAALTHHDLGRVSARSSLSGRDPQEPRRGAAGAQGLGLSCSSLPEGCRKEGHQADGRRNVIRGTVRSLKRLQEDAWCAVPKDRHCLLPSAHRPGLGAARVPERVNTHPGPC